MIRIALVVFVSLCATAAAPRTNRPATRPTAGPAKPATTQPQRVRDGLLEGRIRFLVPADWEVSQRGDGGRTVHYKLPGGKGNVSLLVTPQPQAIPNNHPQIREKLSQSLMAAVKKGLADRNVVVTEPPKFQKDDAFIAKLGYRALEDDTPLDGMHAYRGVGLYLVSVTSSALTDDPDEAKVTHDAAAMILMSVTTGQADPKLVRPVKSE